jgi:hypothetical protein
LVADDAARKAEIGAKVVGHARYIAFQMAEVAVPKVLFAEILQMIADLLRPPRIRINGEACSGVACPIENDGRGASR